MTIAEQLRKAKSLIDTPEKWNQGEYFSADGTRMCASAAIERVDGQGPRIGHYPSAYQFLNTAVDASLGHLEVCVFNDSHISREAVRLGILQGWYTTSLRVVNYDGTSSGISSQVDYRDDVLVIGCCRFRGAELKKIVRWATASK